jgi:hypothetical protein|tara:strand:+ start:4795 stop:5118 length:324 start_codon:yes stop_codon:yes gene_type:complete
MVQPLLGLTPFLDALEEEPRAGFFSFQEQFGRSPRQKEFFKSQFQDIHNRFLGELGKQIRGGEVPTMRFTDFLSNFNFNREFASQPPALRGSFPGQFAPRTRFLFNF